MRAHELVGKNIRKRPGDSEMPIRRKAALTVGAANDWAEQAADRASDAALRRLHAAATADREGGAHAPAASTTASGPLPAMSAAPGAIGAGGGALPEHLTERVNAARAGGSSLPTAVRRKMEGAFGTSFAQVRIHHDGEAHQLNQAMSARAFTAGNDIFFGAGQFQPGNAASEHVLAHELAHTTQDAGVHRQTIHRWNINASTFDWTQTQQVSTVDTGQPVWFFEDKTGDKIVVKNETQSIGLSELSAAMHEKLSGVKSVKHRKLAGGDKQAIGGFITDPQAAKLEPASWARLGAHTRTNDRYMATLKGELGDQLDTMSDFELGHYIHSSQWSTKAQYVAMTFAEGDTAKDAAKKSDRDTTMARQGAQLQSSRLRGLMMNPRHVTALGKLTAVDLFMGNKDRVMSGNLGNWIYEPDSAAMTVIDHVDGTVGGYFNKHSQSISDMRHLLGPLTKSKLAATAKDAVDSIADGAAHFAKDDGFGAWLDADRGFRRTSAEDAMQEGLEEGRKLLIKTFTATRFSGSKKARAVKKSIKEAARQGRDIDTDNSGNDRDYYFRILKARAQFLAKN